MVCRAKAGMAIIFAGPSWAERQEVYATGK